MQIPDYFEQDGDTLTLYPYKPYLWLYTIVPAAFFIICAVFPFPTVTAGSEYAGVLACMLLFGILTIGFARELWDRQPILVLTKKTITTRGIPFYRPKTLNWSEVDDIQLVRAHRNNWIFIYAKPGPRPRVSRWEKIVYRENALDRRRHHLTPAFLPCKNQELINFLFEYALERKPELLENSNLESLKNTKLVIFDCDGVLVDSEILSYETYAKVFAQENFDISPDDLMHRYSGLSLAAMVSAIEKTEQIAFSSSILDKIDKAIREVFVQKLKPVDGVVELLEKIKHAEIPVCIVSNGLRGRVEAALSATGLKKYFADTTIFDVSQVKNGKPAPDLLVYAAQKMGVNPAECLVIDDSVTGITAAKAADMPVIGFLGGSHARAGWYQTRVKRAGATAVVFSMTDVTDLLLNK